MVLSIYLLGSGGAALAGSSGALTETVLETTGHGLQVAHAAGSGRAASLGLLRPVELAHASKGVRARRAALVLDVEGLFTASTMNEWEAHKIHDATTQLMCRKGNRSDKEKKDQHSRQDKFLVHSTEWI